MNNYVYGMWVSSQLRRANTASRDVVFHYLRPPRSRLYNRGGPEGCVTTTEN